MYKLDDVITVEWEITNRCNASCPQCPRNNYGGSVIESLKLTTITLEQAKKMLPVGSMKSLRTVYFCGTYGDPAVNIELIEICSWLKQYNIQVSLHTNGGMQKPEWWKKLANVLAKDDFVVFSIDGLSDTNHVYRRGVNWKTLINNASAFINAGGNAHWDFIVFRHNEHQVQAAEAFSNTLGFKKFNYKKTHRFINKKHDLVEVWPIYDIHDKLVDKLEIPNNPVYINNQISKLEKVNKQYGDFFTYTMSTPITCYHKSLGKIYIGADGYVFPCGWLHHITPGIEAEQHPDHKALFKLFEQAGGIEKVNLNYNSLKNIINTDWFPVLESSWTGEGRLSRCGAVCGASFNPVGAQNENVSYWGV